MKRNVKTTCRAEILMIAPLKCKDRKVQINKLSLTSAHTALALTVQRIVRVMAPFLYSTYDSHSLVHGLVGGVGVTLCCVSLPQSQGNNSKNSVVSSSSTKDSSMSSSAPMVPHLYLVSLLLIASFRCFPSSYRLVLSPHNLFVASHIK